LWADFAHKTQGPLLLGNSSRGSGRQCHCLPSSGQRVILRHYPKDNEPRTLRITSQLAAALETRVKTLGLGQDDLLFANHAGRPISRSTFRARIWLPDPSSVAGIRVSWPGAAVEQFDRHGSEEGLLDRVAIRCGDIYIEPSSPASCPHYPNSRRGISVPRTDCASRS
jgi:hypothetical protein